MICSKNNSEGELLLKRLQWDRNHKESSSSKYSPNSGYIWGRELLLYVYGNLRGNPIWSSF